MANFEPKQFGKYYLLEKLAVGGMAEIYKAKTYGAEGFEKLLAIKRILPHAAADKEFINMLIDEAKLSVLLSHANIVQVYDLGKVSDDYFISMEFIHGVNLRDVLYRLREKNRRLPTDLAAYVASEVCKGLDYAHRKTDSNNQPLGLVHRDISPQNILISYEGEVKIVDFGIAKAAMNISHTMAGILKGKIAYMSPEQAMGKAIDFRTDIFSLGILFYESLTGKKLYTGESQFEVLKKIRTTRIDVTKLPESIPDPLKPILAKALHYKLEERYSSASDMQIALTKYLYATFTDFSPRKLSIFVKDLFKGEMGQEKNAQDQEKVLEAKTGSVSLLQGATQEEIVHRETSSSARGLSKIPIDETRPVAVTKEKTVSETYTTAIKRLPIVVTLLAFLALGLGFFAWKFLLPPKTLVSQMTSGTLHVVSTPPGADIFLNGESKPYKTPAILENLKLNQDYTVGLALDKYGRQEKTVRLENTDPVTLQITLSKNLGILNVISEPAGAAILVNGITTGKVTPATLEDLSLNTEYRVSLSKPNYQDFEQPVTLVGASPQKLMASLKSIEQNIKGSLVLETEPEGAKIYLDNQDIGKTTPTKLDGLDIGKILALKFEKENYEILEKQVTLKDATPFSFSEKLVQKVTPPPQEVIGSLQVQSNPPGARIFLNGKDTGKVTPALMGDLKQGRYAIRLTKENFQPTARNVNIASNKQYSIEERLNEIKKPSEAEQPPPKPPEEQPPTTTGGEGAIKIGSNPSGADVFVNGEHQGSTPTTVKVHSGSVKILVTKGDDKLPCRQTVQVRAGETVSVNCSLGDLFGKVDINSTPPRADVYFDGKNMGKTPLTIQKINRERAHQLRVIADGYKAWEHSIDLGERESQSFNVELER